MSEARTIGRYELHDAFASGGVAHVHFGRLFGGSGFQRIVAIKRLNETYAKEPRFRSMLVDEARVAARVRHANVVDTLDVVEEGDEVFLVMEYVVGEPLSRLARTSRQREDPIPPPIAVALVSGVLHGLHAAHEATDASGTPLGIVHRDVSPQNILVGSDGVPRVVDFGIAKALGRIQSTSHGEVKGKAAYMAPEQLRGEAIDRRVDVFAAGIVLWELLTGKRLFEADSAAASMMRVLEASPEPPSELARGIAPELDAVVLRALARPPGERFATAAEMSDALCAATTPAAPPQVAAWVEALASDALRERAARVAVIEAGVPSAASEAAPIATAQPAIRTRPATIRFAVAGAALLALVLVVALALRRRDDMTASAMAAASSAAAAIEASAEPDPEPPASALASSSSPLPRPIAPRRPPRQRRSAKDCNPPYVVDARGMHVMKPECL